MHIQFNQRHYPGFMMRAAASLITIPVNDTLDGHDFVHLERNFDYCVF